MSGAGPAFRPVALITGASGGIGADLARVFARHGHDLALVARSADKLEALASEIAATGRPRPLVIPCDLVAPGATDHVATALAQAGAQVVILVNNAGFGIVGDMAERDAVELVQIVDLNVRSVLELTLRFLPEIKAARGKVLNVGSIVSFFAGPGMAVYYASKAFVSSFSRALSEEMKPTGVVVTVLHPGLTATGFQARAGLNEVKALSMLPGASAMSVAEAGYHGLMAGRRTIVPGLSNKIGSLILPLIPDAILLPIVARAQKRRV